MGKTTCSCALALQFCSRRISKQVLLISTDPAHNVSDAFLQQFSGEPEKVNGVSNLFACEVDPSVSLEKDIEAIKESAGEGHTSAEMDEFIAEFREWVMSVPGIDEAMALSSVLEHLENGKFDLLVFDTAPTGHTIRLLQLPTVLKLGLEKLKSWKSRLSTLFASVSSLIYKDSPAAAQARAMKKIEEKMETYHAAVTKISQIFKDNKRTEFVCVANATFLSVYETKRLVAELRVSNIACRNVIVNMMMPRAFSKVTPEEGGAKVVFQALTQHGGFDPSVAQAVRDAVELCGGISRIQEKYLKELKEGASKDLHVTLLPLLSAEVRGVDNLTSFSQRLRNADPKLSFSGTSQALSFTPMGELSQNYEASTEAKFMNKTAALENGMDIDEEDEEVLEKVEVGDQVEIRGLEKAPKHNGKVGHVHSVTNGRYEVRVEGEKRPLLIKQANLHVVESKADQQGGGSEVNGMSAVTPEMMSLVQKTLMKPNGVETLLQHELVVKMKQGDDEQMKQFFVDIETNGVFAGLKYLSNQHVMSKLAAVAAFIDEQEG